MGNVFAIFARGVMRYGCYAHENESKVRLLKTMLYSVYSMIAPCTLYKNYCTVVLLFRLNDNNLWNINFTLIVSVLQVPLTNAKQYKNDSQQSSATRFLFIRFIIAWNENIMWTELFPFPYIYRITLNGNEQKLRCHRFNYNEC